MNKMITRAIMAMTFLALLASCQQLFTTSLGKALARDNYPDLSRISLEDALSYLADAQGDQSLAAALVSPLYAAASAAVPGSPTYDRAATALVEAVVLSTGIGQAITSTLETILTVEEGKTLDLDLDALLGSITVTSSAIVSLQMVATAPPASMTATQAYTAAATLMVAILQDDTSLSLDDPDITHEAFRTANEGLYLAAFDLFTHAQELEAELGTTSMFSKFFEGLPFEQ
jgi:hypothetical protein